MTTAFVLINTELGSESEIRASLKEIPEVKEAYMVYGVYDIVARIEAKSMEELKELIGTKIRGQDKVRSTLTMIVM